MKVGIVVTHRGSFVLNYIQVSADVVHPVYQLLARAALHPGSLFNMAWGVSQWS